MSLTGWISECRSADLRLAGIADISTAQWERLVADSVRELSTWRPRGWRWVDLTVEVGDTDVPLPSDFLWADWADLYYLATGVRPPAYPVDGTYPVQQTQLLTPGSSWTDSEFVTTSASGTPTVLRTSAADAAYQLRLRYMAAHAIADPATNTVPDADRGILRDLCLGRAAQIRAKNALLEHQPSLSREYQQLAEQYLAVRSALRTPMGGWSYAS